MSLGSALLRYLPARDLKEIRLRDLQHDVLAGLAVAVLSVPAGIAYALIAGLPPATGLYAAAAPAIVGSLFRSSPRVITGPTNALSLLVGSIVATVVTDDPVAMVATLTFLVGVIQLAAGWLNLGAVVDYISAPVLLGYITGAGVLIVVGQLKNLTGTPAEAGDVLTRVSSWAAHLHEISWWTLAVGLATIGVVVAVRAVNRKTGWRLPYALIAMGLGIAVSALLGLSGYGVATVADLTPVPQGLPPLALPDPSLMPQLVSGAFAVTLLSLVESSSVARAMAARRGERLDTSVEFAGQGLANIAGGLTSGFPTSGSLTRSALNEAAGARSRLAGVTSGLMMLVVLVVLGPVVNYTPVACLAGLLIVIAFDLIDLRRIRTTLRARRSDAAAFLATLAGTWLLPLHAAVEVGVAISIVLFLRRARLLVVKELLPGDGGRLHETDLDAEGRRHPGIRILHVEGALFFGAAGELKSALDTVLADPSLRVLILRLKRTQGLDLTTAEVLAQVAERMRQTGRHLLLPHAHEEEMRLLRRTGFDRRIGEDHLFPSQPGLFVAMEQALDRARALAGARGSQEGAAA